MIRKIKRFMLIIFDLLINVAIASQLVSFRENIHSNDGWMVFGDAKIATPFSIVFPLYKVSPKSGKVIYNSFDLSKGNGLEISFKPSIKKESMNTIEKKNGIQSFAVILSKKFVKNWAEVNDKKSNLIMLRFVPTGKNPEKFKLSIFQNSNGKTNFFSIWNFQSRNLICIQIIKNKLFIYFYGKNIRTIDIQEILEQGKIYVNMLSSLSRKLILNDFKSKTLSEKPKNEPNISLSENKTDEFKDFPKLKKLSNLNKYINAWTIGEKNEKVNFFSRVSKKKQINISVF